MGRPARGRGLRHDCSAGLRGLRGWRSRDLRALRLARGAQLVVQVLVFPVAPGLLCSSVSFRTRPVRVEGCSRPVGPETTPGRARTLRDYRAGERRSSWESRKGDRSDRDCGWRSWRCWALSAPIKGPGFPLRHRRRWRCSLPGTSTPSPRARTMSFTTPPLFRTDPPDPCASPSPTPRTER